MRLDAAPYSMYLAVSFFVNAWQVEPGGGAARRYRGRSRAEQAGQFAQCERRGGQGGQRAQERAAGRGGGRVLTCGSLVQPKTIMSEISNMVRQVGQKVKVRPVCVNGLSGTGWQLRDGCVPVSALIELPSREGMFEIPYRFDPLDVTVQ